MLIGDSVAVNDDTENDSFAIVNKIFTKNESSPKCQITWYYTPKDVLDDTYPFIGEAELFSTNHD